MSDATPPAGAGPGSELVGSVLAGRYRILQKLGEGAMGAVYLGEHLRIGRRDAIKVLRESLAGDPEAMKRFGRGARNVSQIQHPNVCTVYDFGDTAEGRCFLAMEYVPGQTLQDLLQAEGRLPPARAATIFTQVADALQAAHEVGIVHRDLKPANVMVSPGRGGTDAVKVVDFDIAKGSRDGEPGDVTRLGFVIGTPEYMSPEQLLGMQLDGRSDVYSLALVLFRMLTGSLPFRAADTQEMMVQRLTGEPLRLHDVLPGLDVPPALQAALDRALQRRAEDRFESAAAFAQAVAAALAHPAAYAAPRPVAPVSPPPADSHGTRSGVLPTILAPADPGPRPEPKPRRAWLRPTPAQVALGLLAVVLTAGAVWGVTRAMGPPSTGKTALQDSSAILDAPADTAGPAIVIPPDTTMAAPDSTPVKETQKDRDPPAGTGVTVPPDPPKGRGESTDPPGGQAKENDDPPPPVDPPRPRPRYGLTPENAGGRMLDLMVQLGEGPSPSDIRTIRATAGAAYELDGASPRTRALAARVAGDASLQLGEPGLCVTWLQRSLLHGEPAGTRELLGRCRERLP